MCGICGFTGTPDRAALGRMTSLLVHRGPDDEGYFEDAQGSLGFRRLSIIDLKTGHQPMGDADHSAWIVFNGEIFNYRELREELKQAGYAFQTESDTEVILNGYCEWGNGLPSRLIGMFAFALFEPAVPRLTLCRDRLGIKPLYYAQHEGRLVFASEPKAILSFHDFPRRPDSASIEAFLTYLYVPGPRTIFAGIRHLPPAHVLTWTPDHTDIRAYWQIAPGGPYITDEGTAIEELRRLVRDSVSRRLISDVPLGVFLSGGLDSSIVVNEMARETPADSIKTFSIGFEGHTGTFNELSDARLVAEHYGTDHTEFLADVRALERLPAMCWHFDAPFANSSAIPMFLLSELAKRKITVALAGVGGDELFGGYPRDLAAVLSEVYRKFPQPLRAAAGKLASRLPESTTGRDGTRRLKQFATTTLHSPEDEYTSWITYFDTAERRDLLTLTPSGDAVQVQPEMVYRNELAGGFPDILTRVLHADLRVWLPYNLLEYSDKMAMAHGVEIRVPLLDHRLVEYAFSLHPRLKVRGLRGKYALRKAFGSELPSRVRRKRKAGFVAPLGYMYQNEFKGLLDNVFSADRIREHGLFREETVQRLVAEHRSGRRDRTNQLTALLMLDVWHKLYLERTALEAPQRGLAQFY